MNQILVSKKVYVTPKLKRRKRFYKFQFVFSLLIVFSLTSYYVYSEYDKRKDESISHQILSDFYSDSDGVSEANDVIGEETLVIALNEEAIDDQDIANVNNTVKQTSNKFDTVYTTSKGTQYTIDSILNIPSLGINYPIISDCTTELLKISLNKFWGGDPNEVGNYCIVGHNYDGKDIFFGKLNRIQNGDIVELRDRNGRNIKYKVYNKFIVDPTDVACTSQITNGKKEVTLITCSDGGKTRLVVKCREVE